MLDYDVQYCSVHKDEIVNLYKSFIKACITLLSPSMSGLRTLSKVCEEYAKEFDVTFNGNKNQLLCFRGR